MNGFHPGRMISAGARTPEELETLFEDALLLRDSQAVVGLFEEGAVLVVAGEQPACGNELIARLALVMWDGGRTYVADPQQVLQWRDIALIISGQSLKVVRRNSDGIWRYAIVSQSINDGI